MSTNFMLDANIAYLVLVGIVWLVFLALLSPGTGLLEVGVLMLVVIAGWQVYSIPTNWWAFIILAVGMTLFVFSVRQPTRWIYLASSIAALFIGSTFLFRGDGWLPGVNPVLALIVSGLSAGGIWLMAMKAWTAQRERPAHDLEQLVGSIGLARTEVYFEGSILLKKEDWSARSEVPIPAGRKVRVVGRDGFVLLVESVE